MSTTTYNPEHLCKEMERAYPKKEELIAALDELQYALFFLDNEIFTQTQLQEMAFLIRMIRKGVNSEEI